MADPNDLADRLDGLAVDMVPGNPMTHGLVTAAAALLREQAEQLDTLRNAIREHRTSALCNGSMFVANRERDLWDVLDALAAAGGGVPEGGATDEQ